MEISVRYVPTFALVTVLLASSVVPTDCFAEDAQCPGAKEELALRLNQQQELNQTGSLGSLLMDEEERTIANLDTYIADARATLVRLGCSR